MRAMAFVVLLSMMLSTAVFADVPGLINYQGTLSDQYGAALDTTVAMTFSIYTDSTGGTQVWTETQSAVGVNSGLFNVLLGRVNAISDTVFNDPSRWLGVQVGGDPELVPRHRMAAVGYALQSAAGGNDSDWTVDGDNLYRLDGNVGIGRADPITKLDIVGLTRVRGGLYVGQLGSTESTLDIYNSDVSDWELVAASDADRFDIREYGSSPSLSIAAGGNVGIGTDDPEGKLDVAGTAQMTGFKMPTGASNSYVLTSDASGVGTWQTAGADADWTISGNHIYSAVPGSVGIGTSAPAAKLDVQGTLKVGEDNTGYDVSFYGAYVGGRLFWDESKMALRAGWDSDGTHWAPDDSIGLYSLATGYNTKASGSISSAIGGNTTASGQRSTAMGYNTTASGGFSTAMGYNTTASGDASTAMGSSTTASGWASTAMGREVEASGIYSIAMGHHVKAGPANYTMVLGKGIVLGDTLVNNIANSLMVGFASDLPTLFVGPSSGAGTTGKVGIGTTSPSEKLHVAGNAMVDSTIEITGFKMPTGTAAGHVLTSDASGVGTWQAPAEMPDSVMYADSSGYADVAGFAPIPDSVAYADSSGTDRDWTISGNTMYSAVSGAVGIGTTSPNEKLHVAGNVMVDSTTEMSGFKMPTDATAGHVLTSNTSGVGTWQAPAEMPDSVAYADSSRTDGDWTIVGSNMYSAVQGSVGIGTTTPSAKLHVVDSGGNYGYLGCDTSGVYGSGNLYGVYGFHKSSSNYGYLGGSFSAVRGYHVGTENYGYLGSSTNGVYGHSYNDPGVTGYSGSDYGVYGSSYSGYGVYGKHTDGENYGALGGEDYGAYGGNLEHQVSGYLGYGRYEFLEIKRGVYGFENVTNNYGYLASENYGVYGHNVGSNSYGYLGGPDCGVYGQKEINIYGYLGGSIYGAFGQRGADSKGVLGYTVWDANYFYHREDPDSGDGQSAAYAYRTRQFQNDGTGYGLASSNTAFSGYSAYGDLYSFGTAGHNGNDYTRCGGVLGADWDGVWWGSLGYKNSGGSTYGGYFSSYTSGTGKNKDGTAVGIGMGAWGDLFGADIHGKVYGAYVEGSNYALYSKGDVFTNGMDVHLQETETPSMAVLYTNVSTDVTVQTSGFAALVGGKTSITFDESFRKAVSPEVPVVVTVTPTGPCKGVYVSQVTKDGFVVVENGAGKSDVTVAFIAIGRRAGYENPELPLEVISSDYVDKLSRGLHNDADTDTDGEGLYFVDDQLYVGAHPSILPDPNKPPEGSEEEQYRKLLEAQEQERLERERMEEEARRLEKEHRRELQAEEEARRMEEERRKELEAQEALRRVKRVPSRENATNDIRGSTESK